MHRPLPILFLVLLASLGIACEKKEAVGPAPEVIVAPVESRDVAIYTE